MYEKGTNLKSPVIDISIVKSELSEFVFLYMKWRSGKNIKSKILHSHIPQEMPNKKTNSMWGERNDMLTLIRKTQNFKITCNKSYIFLYTISSSFVLPNQMYYCMGH